MAMHAPYHSGFAHGHHGETGRTCAPACEASLTSRAANAGADLSAIRTLSEAEGGGSSASTERPESSLCHRAPNSNNRGDPTLLFYI